MAIWQFNISFIPKKSLIEKYGQLPRQLTINKEGWAAYMKVTDFSTKPGFEDAFTINWWLPLALEVKTLLPMLEKTGDLQQWTAKAQGLLKFGSPSTNDISVCYDSYSGHVEDLSCRIDLRNLDKIFIEKILLIASSYDCIFMDKQARLFEANETALFEAIKLSNAMRFVTDPEEFLSDLSNGDISPE